MRKILILLITFAAYFNGLYGQVKAMRGVVDKGYNFWLYTPDSYVTDTTSNVPVLLFLHGSSLCGNDMNRVRRYGTIDAVEKGLNINAIVVAPQNPGGAWKPDRVDNIMQWLESNYRVDTSRIYLAGMSLGGFGVLDYSGTYPQKVTAAMALCGGTTLKSFEGLSQVPLWIMHGTADRAVSVKQSDRVVNEIKKINDGKLLRYERMNGVNHSRLARIFYLAETYDWLMSHVKEDSTKTINNDISITTSSIRSAVPLEAGKKSVVVIDDRPKVSAATSSSSSAGEVHIIKSGDTLGALARKYKTSVAALCRANNIKSTSILRLGQRIVIE